MFLTTLNHSVVITTRMPSAQRLTVFSMFARYLNHKPSPAMTPDFLGITLTDKALSCTIDRGIQDDPRAGSFRRDVGSVPS